MDGLELVGQEHRGGPSSSCFGVADLDCCAKVGLVEHGGRALPLKDRTCHPRSPNMSERKRMLASQEARMRVHACTDGAKRLTHG